MYTIMVMPTIGYRSGWDYMHTIMVMPTIPNSTLSIWRPKGFAASTKQESTITPAYIMYQRIKLVEENGRTKGTGILLPIYRGFFLSLLLFITLSIFHQALIDPSTSFLEPKVLDWKVSKTCARSFQPRIMVLTFFYPGAASKYVWPHYR